MALINERIKERRNILKMSAEELGKKLGKDRSTIYRYENGYIKNFPIDMIVPIANALNCSPSYLMGWADEDAAATNNTIDDANFITIYDRIRERREQLGMTQQDLADAVGYKTRSAINKIELGIRDISRQKVIDFANALNCSPSYLMGWTDEGTNAKSSTIADATLRMKRETNFLECVELLLDLDGDRLPDAIQLLTILAKR